MKLTLLPTHTNIVTDTHHHHHHHYHHRYRHHHHHQSYHTPPPSVTPPLSCPPWRNSLAFGKSRLSAVTPPPGTIFLRRTRNLPPGFPIATRSEVEERRARQGTATCRPDTLL
ncbi:hypothetical protein E2C01_047013 [Portunus trituberculatus]|uniref:Uncharacterized protein n=1 Tax=Portunus trituberculatus TaxID=210409 RepID=A0A5B7G7N2_PORTR|nr:hypothetical protein [Portunus trituberculatus]